jgi:hypothetical protein
MNENIVYLEVSSWTGISIGATHYYGKLTCGDKRVDVKYKLDSTKASMLNRKDRVKTYRVGDDTNRFDSEHDVIEKALPIWRSFFPKGILLIKGSPSTASPQPVISGPTTLVRRLNVLNQRYEKRWREKPRWDYDPDEVADQIDDLWEKIMRKNFGEVWW